MEHSIGTTSVVQRHFLGVSHGQFCFAFSVAISRSTSSNDVNVAFDTILVDTHAVWSVDRYIVPVASLWIVTAHIGDHPNDAANANFHKYCEICVLYYMRAGRARCPLRVEHS